MEESRHTIQGATGYLQNMASSGYLYSLLAEDGAWQAFVSKAKLSRERAVALHKALRELAVLLAIADRGRLQRGLKGREKFLKVFPHLKAQLVGHISHLHALADHAEKLHRGCTISNVVADSFSAASDILGILGLFLAPVTAEGSLVLSATGLGLGVAATVTNVATSVLAETIKVLDEVEDAPTGTSVARIVNKIPQATRDITRDLEALEQHMNALRLVRANPHLEEDARILATTGSISAQRAVQVQASLEGTPLAMSNEARIQRATTAGAALWSNVNSLVKESKHLYEGSASESAEAVRKLARELEEKLERLMEFYKTI
ncbi:apolipoprotein L3-like [Mus caroli]|uniref:Apolipoprotein L3-like n=1 Tax=Mus caroli TaxID=10089 RepID=A0A6P5R4J9_MUSCR|nr:apolipoprotein L3-like [Mus caroli]XP_021039673.1 apolipoprotein L3-like [Mus caroli]XP_021039674.1 apolipoprotein L3-like [Mus caroli]XP_021039676.1 apolipoprotein L3-like [Mus caroli]XP_021039677.1 apolipoprotein L3-like [Mus caroli]